MRRMAEAYQLLSSVTSKRFISINDKEMKLVPVEPVEQNMEHPGHGHDLDSQQNPEDE